MECFVIFVLCVGNADMRCGRGVNGRPLIAACKSASVSSLLLPQLLEGGQSGRHSCRRKSSFSLSLSFGAAKERGIKRKI